MHGGLMTGWGQCIYTSWSLVAEKEGFLCVFPNASANKMWMIECDDEKMDEITTREKLAGSGVPALNRPTGSVPEFHDVRLVMKLLERMREKYNIDETRVYIQGMSMGNAMTSQVARYMGAHFAAAAGSAAPRTASFCSTAKTGSSTPAARWISGSRVWSTIRHRTTTGRTTKLWYRVMSITGGG